MAVISHTLETLIDDVLLIVLQNIPHTSYPSFARVCRGLYNRVIPELYHTIYYRGDNEFHNRREYDIHLHSEINDIRCFSHTLRTSPSLMSFVKEASFEWMDHTDDVMSGVLALLQPPLKSLHLSTRHWPVYPHLSASITSLAIDVNRLDPRFYIDNKADRETFFSVFSLPALTRLSITGIISWDIFSTPKNEWVDHSLTSNVTHLCVESKTPMGSDLRDIISWPKNLKSFHLFVVLEFWENLSDLGVTDTAPLDIKSTLEPQSPYLEELFIAVFHKRCIELENNDVLELNSFPALKWVGLPRSCLIPPKHRTHVHRLDNPTHPFISLPPQLQTLEMTISNEHVPHYHEPWGYISEEEDQIFRDAFNKKLDVWLREVGSHCPVLREVVLHHDHSGTADEDCARLEKELAGKPCLAALKEAGIRLEIGTTSTTGFGPAA